MPDMGTLYLVRHGQASFGSADYDHLSDLGRRQCVRLGEHLRAQGRRFEAVLTGSLRRHAQSWEGIAEGLGGGPAPQVWPGLNEYDPEAIVHAIHPAPLPRPDTPELFRQHFRLLRQGLEAWMAGTIQPAGMPSHAEFAAGVVQALDHVRRTHAGDVLIVSSGGPIAVAVAHVLSAPAATAIDLNMRIRNSAVTEFAVTPKRHALLCFNAIPNLETPEHAAWVTYA